MSEAMERAVEARREEIARALYECERRRAEHCQKVLQQASGNECPGAAMEPWEECKDTFLGDADAILALPQASGEVVALLTMACASVEDQSNWDKKPYSDWYYKAKQALSRSQAPQAAAVPKQSGEWQLVPKEPTEAMIDAGGAARRFPDADRNTMATWTDMLAAAPPPQEA